MGAPGIRDKQNDLLRHEGRGDLRKVSDDFEEATKDKLPPESVSQRHCGWVGVRLGRRRGWGSERELTRDADGPASVGLVDSRRRAPVVPPELSDPRRLDLPGVERAVPLLDARLSRVEIAHELIR